MHTGAISLHAISWHSSINNKTPIIKIQSLLKDIHFLFLLLCDFYIHHLYHLKQKNNLPLPTYHLPSTPWDHPSKTHRMTGTIAEIETYLCLFLFDIKFFFSRDFYNLNGYHVSVLCIALKKDIRGSQELSKNMRKIAKNTYFCCLFL